MVTELTPSTPPAETEPPVEIPEGIRKARAHLRADLPALLASRWTRGKWACHSKDGRVKIGWNYMKLIGECIRRGIADDEFVIERVSPTAGSEEEEEIDIFDV